MSVRTKTLTLAAPFLVTVSAGSAAAEPPPAPVKPRIHRNPPRIVRPPLLKVVEKQVGEVKIRRDANGACWNLHFVPCPEGQTCDPAPAPTAIKCPEALDLKIPTAVKKNRRHYTRQLDGTCISYFDVVCDPDPNVTCNPPVPRPAKCPPELSPTPAMIMKHR